MLTPKKIFKKRKTRTRHSIRKLASGKPRLSVFRSGRNIYAQVIDDVVGGTLVSASTLDKVLKAKLKTGASRIAAVEVGKAIALRAKEAGISEVVFDRGGYRYHGRVKALAEAAREGGLKI